ncbi:MAG TPA: hypothetical protein VJB59_13485 [Bdellovibrionota bacterium]|nr:hypothetical protein [Bdellovibrionota bacterium]
MIKELKTKLGSALQSALGTAAEVARDSADPTWIPFLRRWMILSLVLHAITAVFSVGHHSADEYFQILEFLNYKLGQTPVQDLPVEFPEMMRPWLQPAIYYVVAKLWLLIGVSNPFTWALSFRMFAGFAGWLSTVILAVSARYWFEDRRARRFAVVVLALIWFFPALHVRPSSESMGGSAFLIGIGLASLGLVERLKSRFGKWAWIFVGACFGLSFEGRFQMALMVVGALAWLLLIGRAGWARFKWIGCGGGAVFLIGRAVDAWGYGAIVLSPWRYFEYNLIRNEVSRYGNAPWWDIFRMSFTESWPFLGLIVVIATLIAWARHPKHVLTWSQIPFFLVHEWISHKELRFFFPIAAAAPILLTLSVYSRSTGRFLSFSPDEFGKEGRLLAARLRLPVAGEGVKRWANRVWKFIVFNNVVALVALMFLPFARNVQFYEALYDRAAEATAKGGNFELYTESRDPFEVLGSRTYFYKPKGLVVRKLGNSDAFMRVLKEKRELHLFQTGLRARNERSEFAPYCHVIFQTLPSWITVFNFGNWVSRAQVWSLLNCRYPLGL